MSEGEQGSGPASQLETLKARARLLGVEFSNNIGIDTLRERINAKMKAVDDDNKDPGDQIIQPVAQAVKAADPEPVKVAEQQPNALELPEQENPLGGFDDDIEEEPETEQTGATMSAAMQAAPASLVQPPAVPLLKADGAWAAPNPFGDAVIKPIAPIIDTTTLSTSGGQGSQGQPVPEDQPMTLRQKIWNDNMKLVRVRIQNLDPKKKDLSGEIFTVANKYLGNVKRFVPYGESTDDGWHIPYVIYQELAARKFLNITTTKDRVTKQVKVVKRWTKEFAIDILPPLTASELAQLATAQAAAGSIDQNDANIIL